MNQRVPNEAADIDCLEIRRKEVPQDHAGALHDNS